MTRRLAIDASFDLAATLNGEQDFRWLPRAGCWHSGVLGGHLVHVRHIDGGLEYRADRNLDSLLGSYFRVDDDLDAIWGELTAGDETLRKLHAQHGSVRLRRQPDRWECVVSYICSANRSVAGTRASVEKIAKSLGEPVELGGDRRHIFPSVERVLEAGEEGLGGVRLGLDKHRKIVAAAREIADGHLDLEELAGPSVHYGEARLRLMGCEGIGPKIADCIALFALDKLDAFPVDRWVRRALRNRYFGGRVPSDQKLVAWALRTFGPYAGYANQLLFHAEREAAGTR
ncbi:MAG: DNA glycosylase [Chloroflexi bacterium]|nr:DNA glycosylase [Chloroflexota bacterium]